MTPTDHDTTGRYEAPTVRRLGTMAELTQGGLGTYDDGFGGNAPFSIVP